MAEKRMALLSLELDSFDPRARRISKDLPAAQAVLMEADTIPAQLSLLERAG